MVNGRLNVPTFPEKYGECFACFTPQSTSLIHVGMTVSVKSEYISMQAAATSNQTDDFSAKLEWNLSTLDEANSVELTVHLCGVQYVVDSTHCCMLSFFRLSRFISNRSIVDIGLL